MDLRFFGVPRAVAFFAVFAMWAGCRSPTEITVSITTDVRCAGLRDTSITVGSLDELEDKPPVSASPLCDDASGTVGSLVIVPSGGKDAQVAVRVVAGLGRSADACVSSGYTGGCIVARRALRFIAGTPLRLPIALRGDCTDVPCSPTETCVHGACVVATIPDPGACAGSGCDDSVLPEDDGGAPAPDAGASDATIEAGVKDGGSSDGSEAGGDAGDAEAGTIAPGTACSSITDCAPSQRCVTPTKTAMGMQCLPACKHNADCALPLLCVSLVDETKQDRAVCAAAWGPHHFGETITDPANDCDTNDVHETNGVVFQCTASCIDNTDCMGPLPNCKELNPGFPTCAL